MADDVITVPASELEHDDSGTITVSPNEIDAPESSGPTPRAAVPDPGSRAFNEVVQRDPTLSTHFVRVPPKANADPFLPPAPEHLELVPDKLVELAQPNQGGYKLTDVPGGRTVPRRAPNTSDAATAKRHNAILNAAAGFDETLFGSHPAQVAADTVLPVPAGSFARGVEEMATPGERTTGALRTVGSAVDALQPLIGPAALENPIPLLKGMGVGAASQYATGKAADAMGADPQQKALAEDIGFFLPTLLGVKGTYVNENGVKGGTVSAFGGKVGAGIASTPEGAGAAVKIGRTRVGVGYEAPTDWATRLLMQSELARRSTMEPPPAPEPPPGPKGGTITPQHVEALKTIISSLPEEMRGPAVREAHQNLANWILQNGTVIGPDGKIYVAKNIDQASKIAANWVNTAVDEHDTSQAPGRGGPQKPPRAEAAGTAPKPAEPNPPAPSSDGAAVSQQETVTVAPHELEGGLEGAPEQAIRPQGGVKPEAESISAETGRIVKGAKVTVQVDGQATEGVVQWVGAGEKSNVARVKVEGNRTVARPVDQLTIVPKGQLTAAPDEITVQKQELEGESEIEQARRGASGVPAEERAVNRVPVEQRPSTTIPQEENASMAARVDSRNLQPKAEEVEQKYEFGSTQINVPKESPLYKEHQKAAAQIADEDLAAGGREENPHVTIRYGLKDTSPEQAAKIKTAVKDTPPFWVSLGETKSFPAGDDGVPLFSEVQKTPELEALRKTVEGAGDFKADDHGEYKPHVTLGFVKPGTEEKYVGKKGLKGETVLVDHVAVTKRDGSQEIVKLQGVKLPENSVRKGGRGESPEPLSGHGATSQNLPSNEEGKQEVGRAPGNETPSERATGTPERLGVPLPNPTGTAASQPESAQPRPLIKDEATKEPEPGTVGSLSVLSIKADPHRFQFKLSTDAKGTSAKLKEVEAFKPHLAGTVSVWKDPADGHFYVTNGHHRLELAERSGAEKINVFRVDAPDAVTARSLAALQNIAEGSATPLDAAKFFRDSGMSPEKLKAAHMPLGVEAASKGMALARLSEPLFNRAIQGDLRMSWAVPIGEATHDYAEQNAVVTLLEKQAARGKRISEDTVRELIRSTKASGKTEEQTISLFGDSQVQRSLAMEKAEVSAYVKEQIAKDRRLFGFVSKEERAKGLEAAGNRINLEENQRLSSEAAFAEEVYNRLSSYKGPIADELDAAAGKLVYAKDPSAVKRDAYQRIREEISKTLGGANGKGLRADAQSGTSGRSDSDPPSGPEVAFNLFDEPTDPEIFVRAPGRLLIRPAPEQFGLFGGAEPMYQITRTVRGQPESILVSQSQLEKLRAENASVERAMRRFDQGSLFASNLAPTFFLKSERVAAEKIKGSMSGPIALRVLENAGVKKEELKWTGLDDFLKSKENVTPQQIQEFLRENDVQVKEVMHDQAAKELRDKVDLARADYGEASTAFTRAALGLSPEEKRALIPTQLDHANLQNKVEDGRVSVDQLPASLRPLAEKMLDTRREYLSIIDRGERAPKFASYQLPGGENYRELLLTLPTIGQEKSKNPLMSGWTVDVPQKQFRSPHFDEPNVLAHVRFNDRTDSDGRKILFVEEIQSDWHQQGRRRGYGPNPKTQSWDELVEKGFHVDQETNSYGIKLWTVYDGNGNQVGGYFNDRAGAVSEALARVNSHTPQGVPEAPFKKDWHELALKRMIRYAAENGYDKLAWTTGAQQAERYDLSKQVASIEVSPRTDASTKEKTRNVHIDLRGNTIPSYIDLGIDQNGIVDNATQAELKGKPLSEVVGKDVADKIMQSDHQTIEGEGLRVGGEGMKGFYDKIIPDFLKSYGKKWGAKIGETNLGKGVRYEVSYEKSFDDTPWLVHEVRPGRKHLLGVWKSEEYANTYKRDLEQADKQGVHSLDITPEMRRSVVDEGQPLFQFGTESKFSITPIEAEYEPSQHPDLPGTLSVSRSAQILVSQVLRTGTFHGMVFTRDFVDRAHYELLKEADRLRKDSSEIATDIEALAQALSSASRDNQHGLAVLLAKDLSGPKRADTLREEFFHSLQAKAGDGVFGSHVKGVKELTNHPAAVKFFPFLRGLGYSGPDYMFVTEMAAKIASLSDLRMFNIITPEEAVDWFTQYLTNVAQAAGIEAVEKFDNERAMHPWLREEFNYLIDSVASNLEDDHAAATERQPDQLAAGEPRGRQPESRVGEIPDRSGSLEDVSGRAGERGTPKGNPPATSGSRPEQEAQKASEALKAPSPDTLRYSYTGPPLSPGDLIDALEKIGDSAVLERQLLKIFNAINAGADSRLAVETFGSPAIAKILGGKLEVVTPNEPEAPAFNLAKAEDEDDKVKPFKFESEEVEGAIKEARGLDRPKLLQRFRNNAQRLYNMATRTYEQLPHTAEFEPLRFSLVQLEHMRGVTSQATIRDLGNLLSRFNENRYWNYSVKVLLDDLAECVKDGLEVPFYQDHEQLKRDHEAISAHVKDDEVMQHAVAQRKQLWERIKGDYIKAMNAIGFKTAEKFKRESYYRHQILTYANELEHGVAGTGQKLKTPTGRGFLKQRQGSDLPINTDPLEAEYSVMAQFRFDTEVAKTIAKVDDIYNIGEDLKRHALMANEAGIAEYFKTLVSQRPENEGMPEEVIEDAAKKEAAKLGQKQAMAISRLEEMAWNDELPLGERGEFMDLVKELSQAHVLRKETKDKLPESVRKQLIPYAAYLLKSGKSERGRIAAATLFKGIAEKKKFIKEKLGRQFTTWRDLVPDGYTTWQPREGSLLYMSKTLPEHVIDELTKDASKQIGITAEHLRSIIAKGQRFKEFVIPVEAAKTLDDLRRDRAEDILHQILKAPTRAWKWWTLHAPPIPGLVAGRAIKFRIRHFSGGAEATWVGNPHAFTKVLKSAHDVWDFMKHGKISTELQPWIDRGGTGSLFRAVEQVSVSQLKQFEGLYQQNKAAKIKEALLHGYVNASNFSFDFMESLLRYAAFLDYKEQLRDGGLKNYGASAPELIDALENDDDKAFALSNALIGGYDDISALARAIKEYIPFWSFQAVNARRYYHFFVNALHGGGSGGGGGKGPGGPRFRFADDGDPDSKWKAFRRAAGVSARATPVIALNVGRTLLKMATLWATLSALNHLFHRKEEDDLPENARSRAHLTVGRTKDGEVLYIPNVGLTPDLINWFGPESPQYLTREWMDGHRSTRDVAIALMSGPPKEMFNQTSVMFKTPFELATGLTFFPDLAKPRPIRERMGYLAQQLELKPAYDLATKKPSRGYLSSLPDAVFNRVDAGQAAYYSIEDLKRSWTQQHGKAGADYGAATPRSYALHQMRLSAHLGDDKAYEKYAAEYFGSGGSLDQIQHSLHTMEPLYGLSSIERAAFVSTLSDEEMKQLQRAGEYYFNYLAPEAMSEDEEEPAPEEAAAAAK